MSDKFDMKVVIDTVTTPLLHARLSAATSYRERAALLRSLAESALRGTPMVDAQLHPVAGATTTRQAAPLSTPVSAVPVVPVPDSATAVDATNEGGVSGSHDVNLIADQFAAYF